jgi:hypothetical protein
MIAARKNFALQASDNYVRSAFETKSFFYCPPHGGGQPRREAPGGGPAGRNVSSRAQAGRNMARARPPARALLALSPFARGTIPRPRTMFCVFEWEH